MNPNDKLDLDQALDVARAAARRADAIAMDWFGKGVAVEQKADASPVTEADRACERAIRETLLDSFPEHAIFGEEYGHHGESRCLWLVDPIDGTRSFIRGLPFWSVQIGLMVDGELVLGVSSAPAFEETAWAVKGQGAFINDRPVHVAGCASLDQADVSFGNLRTLARGPDWGWAGNIVARAARSRGYGDFYSYHRLADGAQDVVIESDVNILDIAALTVIVREAGARISDLDGAPIGLDTSSVLAAGPELHDLLLSSRHE